MTFTEQDLERQAKEFKDLQEEFSRLQSLEATQKKTLGLSDQDLKDIDFNKLSPNEKQMVEEAQSAAKRAGSERASQVSIKSATTSTAGSGRKGVIRL